MKNLLVMGIAYALNISYSTAQIVLNEKYEILPPNTLIPYGQASVIAGKKANLEKLTLKVYYRTEVKDVPVQVEKSGDWKGILPPLPPKTKVILSFAELKGLSSEEKTQLLDSIKNCYDDFRDNLLNPGINEPDTTLVRVLSDRFKQSLPAKLKTYRNTKGESLTEIITKDFSQLTPEEAQAFAVANLKKPGLDRQVGSYIKLWQNAELFTKPDPLKIANEQVVPENLLINSTSRKNQTEVLLTLNELEKRLRDRTDLSAASKKTLLDALTDYRDDLLPALIKHNTVIKTYNSSLNGLINQAAIVLDEIFIASFDTADASTSEILKFASLDVSAVVYPSFKPDTPLRPAYAGFLFTISPYLNDLFPRRVIRFTPTVGVTLFKTTSAIEKPIYYLGASYRINDAFRLTTGFSFFKNESTRQQFEWMFGAGLSLRFYSVGELIRVFNATTSDLSLPDVP